MECFFKRTGFLQLSGERMEKTRRVQKTSTRLLLKGAINTTHKRSIDKRGAKQKKIKEREKDDKIGRGWATRLTSVTMMMMHESTVQKWNLEGQG
jgi:hypothetical protein